MSDPAIRVAVRPDRVAVLTFDQPGRAANVLTHALWHEFDAELVELEAAPDVRGLVLASAKPGVFIAGADLKFLAALPGPNDPACRLFVELGLGVLDRLERLPFPTCAAIDGAALGGGLEVALACDFRICGTHPRVELGLPEVTLGLIPGWGGTQRLPRVIGMEAAALALATGKDVRDEMDDPYDLVDTEAGGEFLMTCAASICLNNPEKRDERRGAKQSPLAAWDRFDTSSVPADTAAVREALSVISRGAELPLADAIRLETEAFLRLAGSDESKRLIGEFFASRKRGSGERSA